MTFNSVSALWACTNPQLQRMLLTRRGAGTAVPRAPSHLALDGGQEVAAALPDGVVGDLASEGERERGRKRRRLEGHALMTGTSVDRQRCVMRRKAGTWPGLLGA